jgi:hypothetical protein
MNLRDEVEKIKTEGYSEANAESKLCQDIVLKAIAESGMARNVSLLINSKAQMITEKLKSLVRFASRSTRYKDVFDICYLSDEVDKAQLRDCIDKYIFSDETLRNVATMDDVVKRVERVFSNKAYVDSVSKSGKNWLDMPVEAVLKKDLEFIKSL